MSLTLRFLAVAALTFGAIASIRREGFSSRDRKQLAWILGSCAVLIAGVVVAVVVLAPGSTAPR